MTVNDIYTQVCDVLLEPVTSNSTGLQLGMLTLAQFLDFFSDVYTDFFMKSGIIKALINVAVTAGTGVYTEPDVVIDVEEVMFNERYIHRETGLDLDNLRFNWRSKTGIPQVWNEDRLNVKQIESVPAPSATGFVILSSANFFGTIKSTTAPVDVDFLVSANLFGTISSYTSATYLEMTAGMFGTLAKLVTSTNNLTLLSVTKPPSKTFVLADLIQALPDSFSTYLKYGILQRVFEMDGEWKDPLRARYCGARYEEGLKLAKAVMQELEED